MASKHTPVEIFIAYSRKDTTLLDEFRVHLKLLERTDKVRIWYDGKIEPGAMWEEAIKEHLHSSDIILLLVSADAIASDYFYEKEVADALERHRQGHARVVPMIMRPCAWNATPLAELQALPKNGIALTTWPDRDEAFADATNSLLAMVNNIEQLKQGQAEQAHLQKEADAARHSAAEQARQEAALREREAEAEQQRTEQERRRREAEALIAAQERRTAYNNTITRARELQQAARWAEAHNAWQQALVHYEPDFPESKLGLQTYIADCNVALQQRADYDRYMAEAKRYLQHRKWPRAINAAHSALQVAPDDAAAQHLVQQAQAGHRQSALTKMPYLKWGGMTAGVLLAVFIIVKGVSGPEKESEADIAAREYAEAFRKAEEENNLQVWRNFLDNWPEGTRTEEANRRKKELNDKLVYLVKSAKALQTVDKDVACQYLRDALKIAPDAPEALRLIKATGCE